MPKRKKAAARKTPGATAKPTQARTKQAQLLTLLRRPQGTTIAHAAKTLDWQPHSVRGVISGVLKKRLGLTITSEKGEGGRIYRVAPANVGKQS